MAILAPRSEASLARSSRIVGRQRLSRVRLRQHATIFPRIGALDRVRRPLPSEAEVVGSGLMAALRCWLSMA